LKVFQYGLICVQYVLIILVKNLLILVKFHYLCWICVEFVFIFITRWWWYALCI